MVNNRKSKVLLHIHMYRLDQLKNITKYVKNVLNSRLTQTDIIVTVVDNCKSNIDKILKCIPSAQIMLVENKGYDVGPFFEVLKKINLNNYDFVVKMHTKDNRFFTYTNTHKYYFTRRQAIKILFEALFKNTNVWEQNINNMLNMPKLGLVGSSYFIIPEKNDYENEKKIVERYYQIAHLTKEKEKSFVAGTIFIVKAQLLEYLKNNNLLDLDFKITTGAKESTLAHVFEHILGYIIGEQGYTIKGFDSSFIKNLTTTKICQSFKQFLCTRCTTSSGKSLIKILKIPVYNKKIERNHSDVL